MMTLTFAPYDPEQRARPHEISSNAIYLTLRRAVESATTPPANRGEMLTAVELQKKLLAVAEEMLIPVGDGLGGVREEFGYRLPPAGASLTLSPAEHAMLLDDWKVHSKQHGRGASALLLAVADFLATLAV